MDHCTHVIPNNFDICNLTHGIALGEAFDIPDEAPDVFPQLGMETIQVNRPVPLSAWT